MQRELRVERAWRHWTGRILLVLAVALLAFGPVHAKDKDKKRKEREAEAARVEPAIPFERPALIQPAESGKKATPPDREDSPALYERPSVIRPEGGRPPPSMMMREAPRPVQQVSIDRIIDQVQRRYKARV